MNIKMKKTITNQIKTSRNAGKTLIMAIMFMVVSMAGSAQTVSSYSFTSFIGTPTDINGLGTLLGSGSQDDMSYTVTLPFTFTYHGTNFTTAGVNTNGYIVMGGSSTTFYSPLVSVPNSISALGGDLYGSNSSHRLEYLTSGTTPNRVLRIQWSNWDSYANSSNEYTFQIALFETSNQIQINYLAAPGNIAHTLQVGLTGATTADFNARTTTTNWSATTAAYTHNATCSYTSTVKPAANLCFQWNGSAGCSASFTLAPDSLTSHHYTITPAVTGVAPFTYYWSWGDSTFDTTAYPSHTYADTGLYTICMRITDATGCQSYTCDSSYHILRTQNTMAYVNVLNTNITTGINTSETSLAAISIYPNPAHSSIIINANNNALNQQLIITDIIGNRIIQKNLTALNNIIDISSWSKGIYLVQVKNDKESVVKKVVVE